MKVKDDPTLAATCSYLRIHPFKYNPPRAFASSVQCPLARSAGHWVKPQFTECNPYPSAGIAEWSYGMGDQGIDFSFDTYFGPYQRVQNPGKPLGQCLLQSGAELVGIAGTIAQAMYSAASQWQTQPNAAAINALLFDYSAGEIGAMSLIIGAATMLDAAVWIGILTAIGLTVFTVWNTVRCMHSSTAYQRRTSALVA